MDVQFKMPVVYYEDGICKKWNLKIYAPSSTLFNVNPTVWSIRYNVPDMEPLQLDLTYNKMSEIKIQLPQEGTSQSTIKMSDTSVHMNIPTRAKIQMSSMVILSPSGAT